MAKKRKTASTRKKSSHKRKTSAKKTSRKTKPKSRKTKAKPAKKAKPTIGATFTSIEAFLLTSDQKLNIYARVLACLRRLVNDDQITYSTNLRVRYNWDEQNFIQLANDLPRCFKKAGWTIPRPLSKPALAKCKSVEDVCAVVVAAYES